MGQLFFDGKVAHGFDADSVGDAWRWRPGIRFGPNQGSLYGPWKLPLPFTGAPTAKPSNRSPPTPLERVANLIPMG